MARHTSMLMVFGLAVATAAGCAHGSQKVAERDLKPKATWQCPKGTYPDLSKSSPNCLSQQPWTQGQVDQQFANKGDSRISFSCPYGMFPDSTQPMPNCLSRSLNTQAPQPGISEADMQAKLQQAREEGAQDAKKQYEDQLAQKEQEQAPAQAEEGNKVEFEKRVAFNVDSAKLSEASKATLDEVASDVKSNEDVKSILVDGHADNTGTDKINDRLSEDRANAIRDYLEGKGVAADKIETVAHGSDAPIASNDNAAGRALNRSAGITAMK